MPPRTPATCAVTLQLDSYIAQPAWPELRRLDALQRLARQLQQRQTSAELTDEQAQVRACRQQGLTAEQLAALRAAALRPWYRVNNQDPESPIVLPRQQLLAALLQAHGARPVRDWTLGTLRTQLRLTDFLTTRVREDDVFYWRRSPPSPHGRGFEADPVLRRFTATGVVTAPAAKLLNLRRLFTRMLRSGGVGGHRPLGYGFGHVVEFHRCPSTPSSSTPPGRPVVSTTTT